MKKALFMAMLICISAVSFAGCSADKKASSSQAQTQAQAIVTGTEAATQQEATQNVSEQAQVQQGEAVDASWFNDAVFLGDSVTLKLSYYCDAHPEALGTAQFFCAGSLGYTNALWDLNAEDAVHPYYKGSVQLSENCAVATGAKKVFVMLGMNDIGLYGVEDTLQSLNTLLSKIHTNSPEAAIYVQSVTPILNGFENGSFSNETVRAFNARVSQYCEVNGLKYIDIYSLMCDENGYLKPENCGDPEALGIHFTDSACEIWIDALKRNAA